MIEIPKLWIPRRKWGLPGYNPRRLITPIGTTNCCCEECECECSLCSECAPCCIVVTHGDGFGGDVITYLRKIGDCTWLGTDGFSLMTWTAEDGVEYTSAWGTWTADLPESCDFTDYELTGIRVAVMNPAPLEDCIGDCCTVIDGLPTTLEVDNSHHNWVDDACGSCEELASTWEISIGGTGWYGQFATTCNIPYIRVAVEIECIANQETNRSSLRLKLNWWTYLYDNYNFGGVLGSGYTPWVDAYTDEALCIEDIFGEDRGDTVTATAEDGGGSYNGTLCDLIGAPPANSTMYIRIP